MFIFRHRTGLILATVLAMFGTTKMNASGQQTGDLRTPKPPDTPQIHGPHIYGVRPGHPFLYRIPCTGIRSIRFSAKNLPKSLKLDSSSGIISGQAPEKPGDYAVELQAVNASGRTTRSFKIMVGNRIGLTPQMGWNDWYTFYDHITEKDIRNAAAAMVSSGMADYGYQYVDIDDCWARRHASDDQATKESTRDAQGNILPGSSFPDMPGLTASIHALGLKAGIYTSPGPWTCGGFEGAYGHEEADARRFSQWGFDLLKYDWCSYSKVAKDKSLAAFEEPYAKMGRILQGLDRDVIFNMCQYGQADVWKWGRQVGGNSWRTTGDLGLAPGSSLPGFYSIGFANAAHNEDAGPGGWNDPDYILIGMVGNAHNISAPAQKTGLTADEQYSYMSMWSLMASPLIFSGDVTKLDEFTKNVLCNSEVIDIDQDSLGKQAAIVRKTDQDFVLAKPLEDGSLAVGLFNLTTSPRRISVSWKNLGVHGQQKVRDAWRQRDLGEFGDAYSVQVAPHGVELIKLMPLSGK